MSSTFPSDYVAMAKSFLQMPSKPKLCVMMPPPLYKDGVYDMNQSVINTLFRGGGAAGRADDRRSAQAAGLSDHRHLLCTDVLL